ncbi:cbs-domain-containing membrane protein [Halogeometricum borinquense DSM 11551]|uniref:CBS-domain-containing membrane protein n=2 Tax=Halogeometricum borinquense TaxID=60847 RepID=E4NPC0_HALBP|nr:CBS domain-containing protein [Halogeometricum borinquense]ADQ66475.1 CBS-domain-containing membrane protein [Halogeometricum borinquense DSM 11551]ELY31194.1 cbs-domain-containing membrane protein [Halogeometricum borinquense DSM 11551]RYJ14340.1 CBS domain-containing protein [Halogeometricum borinquense]
MQLSARDLMTEDVETVSPDDDVSDVLGRLARADFNGFPVVDEDDHVVGIVTQHDLVGLFETKDRTLWIPIGLPPFMETVTYAVDISWDDFDLGVDLVKNMDKPIKKVMTPDVVTVEPDADLDAILDLLADDERDINRLPVIEDGRLVGVVARQDVIRAIRDRRLAGN